MIPHTISQTKELGKSIARMFVLRLTPLQIMLLVEARYSEGALSKGQHLFANRVRKKCEALYYGRGTPPPSRQAFWDAFRALQDRGFLYIAPHKPGTSKRAVALTAEGESLFTYPKSTHPFAT